MNIMDHLIEGNPVKLRNGWEYERIEQYEGQHPGIIIGVYRPSDVSGWTPIAHTEDGKIVIPPFVQADTGGLHTSRDFDLVPGMRKFIIKVRRVVTEDAVVEVEATSQDEAEDAATDVAEDNKYDLEWEEYNTDYEMLRVLKEVPID